ncbi:hypothetical protein AAMO2058_000088300 [Amorphochlora amoebiformis]
MWYEVILALFLANGPARSRALNITCDLGSLKAGTCVLINQIVELPGEPVTLRTPGSLELVNSTLNGSRLIFEENKTPSLTIAAGVSINMTQRSSIIISSIKLETDLLFIDKTSYVRALWAYRKSDLGSSLLNVGGGGGRGGTGASSPRVRRSSRLFVRRSGWGRFRHYSPGWGKGWWNRSYHLQQDVTTRDNIGFWRK